MTKLVLSEIGTKPPPSSQNHGPEAVFMDGRSMSNMLVPSSRHVHRRRYSEIKRNQSGRILGLPATRSQIAAA